MTVINRHLQNGKKTCHQLSKRLPDNITIFAAEATAISLALNYYRHLGSVHYDVVVYSDSMSCLQAIEGEDTENPFICHIMNLLWLYRPTGKYPLYRFEATGHRLHSAVGSNQVGCSCAWPRSLPRETNTGATKEIPALNQS